MLYESILDKAMRICRYDEKLYRDGQVKDWEERLEYLMLEGEVGRDTFGFDRYTNQALYNSSEWRKFRREIIIRDGGCDMGIPGETILTHGEIHHINPISVDDVLNRDPKIFDRDNVVLVSPRTHKTIHYSSKDELRKRPRYAERKPNDTCPWRKEK